MTTSVDVLAVMALDANHAYHWRREGSDTSWAEENSIQSEVARAAVAELIEASEAYLQGEYHDNEIEARCNYNSRRRKERSRFSAALARVKGA